MRKPQISKVKKRGNVKEREMCSWKRLLWVRDVHVCMLRLTVDVNYVGKTSSTSPESFTFSRRLKPLTLVRLRGSSM